MSAPRFSDRTPFSVAQPAAKLALTGVVPVVAVLALGPLAPSLTASAFTEPVSQSQSEAWAGGLETRQAMPRSIEPATLASSTSYTSGFDPAAAGVTVPRPEQPQSHIVPAHACGDESASSCGKIVKAHVIMPLPRPASVKLADARRKNSNGLFGLAWPRELTSPFTYVGDKVASLFKKS
jgi:hypothetical protein